MGKSYKVKCRYCGTLFEHYVFSDHGAPLPEVGHGEYIEMEMAIRCPGCHRKLNNMNAGSNRQMEVVYM